MGELIIRRNRGFAVPQYQRLSKAEKQTSGSPVRQTGSRAAVTVSETLRQLMTRVSQAEQHIRAGCQTLQTGEAALAEVQDSLGRMEELAQESAGEGAVNRAALQAELEQLRGEIDRIAQDGTAAGLFQDGDGADGLDALVDAVMEGLSARRDGVQNLPVWLLRGIAGGTLDKTALLAALGVDGASSGAELLAALGRFALEDSPAAGYLATLYLGAVISGGVPSGDVDPAQAAEGLRQLLDAVAEGISLDQAMDLLTGGLFANLSDFQAQFTGGTAPGLELFLMNLLLSVDAVPSTPDIMALLAGGGGDMELLSELLTVLEGAGAGPMELLTVLEGAEAGSMNLMTVLEGAETGSMNPMDAVDPSEGTALQFETPEAGTPMQPRTPQLETWKLGTVQVAGRDVSGAVLDQETGVLTVDTAGKLILRGLGQEAPALRLTGSGAVTLQQVNTPLLAVESAQAQVLSAGESVLAQVRLGEGSVLTLDGSGLLHIGNLQGGASNVLRLTGGAVVLARNEPDTPAVPVVVDGPVFLMAAKGITVYNAQREPLTPFDMMWKTLLPDWASITSLAVDGRQRQMALRTDNPLDLARLWLLKGNSSHGYPAHTIVLQGRDRAGHLRTRYVYLRWNQREESFQEISMYPNPFVVTGGEQDQDWRYEEESQTLCILTGQVTAIAGGAGTDANQLPFSGRIALADGIGTVKLTLDGVVCKVPAGRAFSLGRGNDVTLLLQRGTENHFESGAGCAGISLGDGTSLRIDQAKGARGAPHGSLTATGGSGGAGIGRDSGTGQEQTGSILICGGTITATGTGGGAGIGGALGASVGEIRIQGGMVTAQADCCAAAIGAGIQGACGDIVITGSARVVKARGGGPDGDIGGCLFGNCGKIQVSAGTDIGGAKLWTKKGLSIQVGTASVTLPRFRVSARALRLDGVNIATREAAQAALAALAANRRWITQLQGAYGAMYGQLEQSFGGLHSILGVVRSTDEVGALLGDMRQALRQDPWNAYNWWKMEDVRQLLR